MKKIPYSCNDVGPIGPYSKWALAAKVGDPMGFMGPLGIFTLDKESTRNKVFVATGQVSWIFMQWRRIIVLIRNGALFLCIGDSDMKKYFLAKRIEELAAQFFVLNLCYTFSQPTDSWQGSWGHVQDRLLTEQQNVSNNDYYLCGNRAMLLDMRARLKASSVPDAQVKFELFY